MVENKPFSTVIANGEILMLVINSAIYVIIGVISFKHFENMARDRGLLGVY